MVFKSKGTESISIHNFINLVVPSKSRLARCSAGFYTRPELLDPDFLAPEEFSQGYFDQSVDIYKAPAVAHWILEWAGQDGIDLLTSLESIHNQCKVKKILLNFDDFMVTLSL